MSFEDYQEGFKDGQRSFAAERTKRVIANAAVTEALDRLIRYYDTAAPDFAEELRKIGRDYHHPSRIWAMEGKSG